MRTGRMAGQLHFRVLEVVSSLWALVTSRTRKSRASAGARAFITSTTRGSSPRSPSQRRTTPLGRTSLWQDHDFETDTDVVSARPAVTAPSCRSAELTWPGRPTFGVSSHSTPPFDRSRRASNKPSTTSPSSERHHSRTTSTASSVSSTRSPSTVSITSLRKLSSTSESQPSSWTMSPGAKPSIPPTEVFSVTMSVLGVAADRAGTAGGHVVDLVLGVRLVRELPPYVADLRQLPQDGYHDRRSVDLEEAARRGAGVGEAEAVRSERTERARHIVGDLVLDLGHVVGHSNDHTGLAGELRRHERDPVTTVDVVRLLGRDGVTPELVPARHAPHVCHDPKVLEQQLLRLQDPRHTDAGRHQLSTRRVGADALRRAFLQQVHPLADALDIDVLRLRGLRPRLVVDGHVEDDVLGILPVHALEAVLHDLRDLVRVGRVVMTHRRIAQRQQR